MRVAAVRTVAAGIILLLLSGTGPAAGKDFPLTILYSNTNNGKLQGCNCPRGGDGGLDRRATVIKDERARAKHSLLIDSGDMVSVMPDTGKAGLIFRIMKRMEYDFITLGDQEFMNGVEYMKRILEEGELPFYSATLRYIDTGTSNIYPLVPPYAVLERGGRKIGLVGAVCNDAFKFFPSAKRKNLLIADIHEVLPGILSHFASEKADIIILVSHCGYPADKKLAAKYPAIDVIVGGHTQTLLQKPEKVNRTLIVQAGEEGERLGRLTLQFNDAGEVTSHKGELIPLTRTLTPDADVADMIRRYNESRARNRFWH